MGKRSPNLESLLPPHTAPSHGGESAGIKPMSASAEVAGDPPRRNVPSRVPPSHTPAIAQRGRKIRNAAMGPAAKELLLLDSSHQVVSEGARDGALVFWLEPQTA